MEHHCHYGFGISLDQPFDQAVANTRSALQKQGFGIMSEIDIQTKMQEKLGVDFRPYLILGACIPPLAYRMLGIEPHVGLLMPCNVIIYEENAQTCRVMAMNPSVAMELVNDKRIDEVACQVKSLLEQALHSL